MLSVSIEPTFESWRAKARGLIAEGARPEEVSWTDSSSGQGELFSEAERSAEKGLVEIRVGKAFLDLAKTVACNVDSRRWAILYEIIWRMSVGNERHLLGLATDSAVSKANAMAKEVRRDIHKMRAFVRFRKVGETESGREQFVSWFEPFHYIVRLNAPFFAKRFAGMDWSILTPQECAHWDGERVRFTSGVSRSEAPDEDALETLWLGYYRSIFNPARLKLKAMQAEMPVKYWKNLPEAPLIRELTNVAARRRDSMVDREAIEPGAVPRNVYLAKLGERNRAPVLRDTGMDYTDRTLDELKDLASHCRACPLWEKGTQTVFGEGDFEAEIMLIGEQPGDREDIIGRPFQGPAGKLLDHALEEAGLDREDLYVTNAVKHFKWKPRSRGKRRLHDKANRAEMKACRPWLLGEIARVRPKVIVTLGNTAAQSVVRPNFRILSERGDATGPTEVGFDGRIVATVHPSFLLRLQDESEKRDEFSRFVSDLSMARAMTA